MILWYEDGLSFLELKTTRQASTGPCLLLNFYNLPISNFRYWQHKNYQFIFESDSAKPFKTLGCCRIGFHRYEGYWRRNFRLQKDQHGLALCVATDNLLGWRFGLAEPSVTYQWLDFESQLEWNFTRRSTWTSLVILQNSLSGWLLAILKTLLKECVQQSSAPSGYIFWLPWIRIVPGCWKIELLKRRISVSQSVSISFRVPRSLAPIKRSHLRPKSTV